MATSHPRGEPHQHQRLAERFEQRAARLRKQADILLYIIIGVLAVGAGAFVFANDISRFTLQPRTAEDQYAAVEAAENKNRDQINPLSKQIKEIMDTAVVPASFDDNIKTAISEYTTLERNIIQYCKDIIRTTTTARQNFTNNDPEMIPPLSVTLAFVLHRGSVNTHFLPLWEHLLTFRTAQALANVAINFRRTKMKLPITSK